MIGKGMNRIKAFWRNGGFGKMDDHPLHIKPPPYQNECSPQNFGSNHPCCKFFGAAFKYVPQPTETIFAFSSVLILLLWVNRRLGHL